MPTVWQALQQNFEQNLSTTEAWHRAIATVPMGVYGILVPLPQQTETLQHLQREVISGMYDWMRQWPQWMQQVNPQQATS